MSAIDIATSLLRGVHVAALVSLFGTLLFAAAALPAGSHTAQMRGLLRRLTLVSALAGLIAGIAWLMVQTAAIAGADSVAMTLHAVPTVALQTQFGHWLLLRLVLLIAVLPLLWRGGIAIPIVLAGAALAVQPMLGHPGAIGGSVGTQLIASEALHLLAAGAWLGGLLPLFLAVGRLPHEAAAAACHSFTPIGLASVLLLAGTAVMQVAALMGGLSGLLGTGYGQVALVKLGVFVVLLVLAAANRLVLTDRLPPPPARGSSCGSPSRPRWCSARLSSSPPPTSPRSRRERTSSRSGRCLGGRALRRSMIPACGLNSSPPCAPPSSALPSRSSA